LGKSAQTLGNVKNPPLGSRNIHKIQRRNDLYLAKPAIRPLADRRTRPRLQSDPARHLRRAIAGWIAVSDGMIDRNGKPLGTDFSNVYAAGRLTWQGRPADAYVPALQHAAEKATFGGRDVPFYGWHYPPFFFAVAVMVAAVPCAWGLAIRLAASSAACLAALRDPAPTGNAADRHRVRRGVRRHRPWPEWIPDRSPARRRAAAARDARALFFYIAGCDAGWCKLHCRRASSGASVI
jgi:hypothetical protein